MNESQARAGDAIHFSISDIDDDATYKVEVEDRLVAAGSVPDEGVVSGQFTMPDLGPVARKVTIKAQVTEDDERETRKQGLQFLGPAVVAAPPPAVPAASAPPPVPVAVPAPAIGHAPAPGPSRARQRSSRQADRKRKQARTRERRSPGAAQTPGAVHRGTGKRRLRRSGGARARKRGVLLDAPLFRGVPESPAAGSRDAPSGGSGFLSLNAIRPPTTVLTSAREPVGEGGAIHVVVVPLILGCAALLLASVALARRGRPSRRPRAK